jgi:hypothetical protein
MQHLAGSGCGEHLVAAADLRHRSDPRAHRRVHRLVLRRDRDRAGAHGVQPEDARPRSSSWGAFTFAISAIWLVVAIISIWTPDLVSGADRTHVPIAALVSPIAGVLATAFASVFVAGSAGGEVKE